MKMHGLRWWIIILIFIATVINYIDRTAFALLWPEMGKDLADALKLLMNFAEGESRG